MYLKRPKISQYTHSPYSFGLDFLFSLFQTLLRYFISLTIVRFFIL